MIQNTWVDNQSLSSFIETATTVQGLGFLCMEDFFRGELQISDINIFENMPGTGISWDGSGSGNSIIDAVKNSVAGWYYSLRNIAAVGLLCVLIYTAIRILLSTIAEDKAHYKDLLVDWVKATCLVVFVHVLMIIILNVTDSIVDILVSQTNRYSSIAWVRSQLIMDFDMTQVVYLIMYGVLIYYTVYFTISYVKRFLYTMLLIIIAPIVSLIYAFGKEGKTIFQKWLKEFTVNAFLQPYHMLIYTVLFGFVASIANSGQNIFVAIYALVVLHFIKDAEKYYRALFGMDTGVAGIGQVDTGMKTVEKVKDKMVKTVAQIGKVALSVATLAIPVAGGAAAAAGAAQAAQAGQAASAATDAGNIANGFNGENPPLLGGPDGDPLGGPDGDPLGGPDGDPLGGPDGDPLGGPDIEPLEEPDINLLGGDRRKDSQNENEQEPEKMDFDGQDIKLGTITAQNLDTQTGDINNIDTQNLNANGGDIKRINTGNQFTNNQQIKDEQTQKEEKTRRVIGNAVDTIFDTSKGSTIANTINSANEIYQQRILAGETPEEAARNSAILALDNAINADAGEIRGSDIPQDRNDINTNFTNTNKTESSNNIGINATKNTENKVKASKKETVVKPGSVGSENSNVSSQVSQSAMEKMIKETMRDLPGKLNMPDDVVDKVAKEVAQNLEESGMKDIDMKDFEELIDKAMKNMNMDMNIGELNNSSKSKGNAQIDLQQINQ